MQLKKINHFTELQQTHRRQTGKGCQMHWQLSTINILSVLSMRL